jgi:UrcA family protein
MATIFTRFAASLALSGAVLAAPAFAANPAEQAPSIAVRTNDLDLATEAGARTLDHRIHRAALAVCPDLDGRDLNMTTAILVCRATALASGQAKAQLALAKARGGNAYATNTAKTTTPGL